MSVVVQTGFTGISEPLTHPRVGYVRRSGTVTVSSSVTGFLGFNADNSLTYTAWEPSSVPALWQLSFDTTQTVSYLGVAVHNAGSSGSTIRLRRKDGAIWSDVGGGTTITPTTDDAILFLFGPLNVDGIGIGVTGSACRIGVIAGGPVMEWPRAAEWTGLPITESRQYRHAFNESESGNWLGRSLISSGISFDVEVNNLSETYRGAAFKSFADYANAGDGTFFIAPRPGDYPDEVAYAWPRENIRMSRQKPNKDISGRVELKLGGYSSP